MSEEYWPDGKILDKAALTHMMGPGFIMCCNIGVAPAGEIWLRQRGATWEARQHVQIMSPSFEDEESHDKSPFSDDFHANYARGVGLTQQVAIEALVKDRRSMADGLFAG